MKKALSNTYLFLSAALLLTSCSPQSTEAPAIQSVQMDIPDEYKIGGFAVGLQAYTYNRFSLMEAIEKTEQAGGRVIELYPGQRLNPEGEERFNHFAGDDVIAQVKAKLDDHGIIAVNYGVVNLRDEEESRQVFEFARKMGVQAVTSEPTMDIMDRLEGLVEEFDIMLAIHNHPPRPNNPDYRVWDPEYVFSMVEGRDPRLGACADIGHWMRSEIMPVDGLKILEGRLISLHMVDVDRLDRQGSDVIHGHGIGDMGGVLEELRRQNFGGHISIEYETNWENNVPDVAQNIGFIRGWVTAKDN